jgi:class 3 adenylate cyclase
VLARFCCGCGSRLEPAPDSGSLTSLAKPERRQMTVLFCDLVGSTQLSRAMDPEDWHQLLHRIHSQCGEIIGRCHGHVAQYLGDGLLAYFGYPIAGQDDPRRAVAAGLELVRQAAAIESATKQTIRVRVGIHTGPVVVGNIGSSWHQESLALGETLNLAARIQEFAPADTVVVSPETHRLVDGFFHTTELGAFLPKGFSRPLTLHRVLDASGLTTRLEAASATGLTPLVGRNNEAVALAEAWDLALAGRAPVLLLIGEPGIGKSRLIHVLKEQLGPQSVCLIELRCSEHARSSAFHPLIDSLQRQVGLRHGEPADEIKAKLGGLLRHAGLSEQQIAMVASLFGVHPPPAQAPPAQLLRPALLEALSAWIVGTGERRPTLLVV